MARAHTRATTRIAVIKTAVTASTLLPRQHPRPPPAELPMRQSRGTPEADGRLSCALQCPVLSQATGLALFCRRVRKDTEGVDASSRRGGGAMGTAR
jgi:hypothetical protein